MLVAGYITLSSGSGCNCSSSGLPPPQKLMKAASVPEAKAKPDCERARPATDATLSGAPTKTAKTVAGKKVSHVEGRLECNIQES
jgi:hypothetical protein